ncbi:MAG: hypothetical protein NUV80_05520 [Candidatus Berkelbacteria bacterium]|nr:hypothetical protein [Candidatus Berkelbacteria bacterium]
MSNTTQLRDHIRRVSKLRLSGEFEFDGFVIDRNRLRETTYISRGRMTRAILALYASRKPRDWSIFHRDVVTDVYFLLSDKPNLHHIFPTDFVQKQNKFSGIHSDSLMNIAFLAQFTNLKFSNKNPLEYIPDYESVGLDEILEQHLIAPDLLSWARAEQLPDEALTQFIDLRVETDIQTLRG